MRMFWSAELDRDHFRTLFTVVILYYFIPLVFVCKLQRALPVINSDHSFASSHVVTSVTC